MYKSKAAFSIRMSGPNPGKSVKILENYENSGNISSTPRLHTGEL